MRISIILSMNLILLTGLASSVMAGAEASPLTPMANQHSTVAVDHVVFPTGIYPTDVNNVQAAVSQGGTVLLKAENANGQPTAFEFGFDGVCFITDDVTILGEGSDSAMTTICGGWSPILCFAPVYLAVRGIHFEGPRYCAIGIGASAGADLSSNFISGVIGVPYTPDVIKGQGIWIAAPWLHHYVISGSIVIADNIIEDVDAPLGYGITLYNFGAETTVSGNQIRGMNTAGILAAYNAEVVCVKDNIIVPGPERYADEDLSIGNGIWAVFSLGGDYYFANNTVICENPMADGIAVYVPCLLLDPVPEPEIVIERNHVTMLGSWFGGISISEGYSSAYVGQNRIDGQGSWAIGAFSNFPELPPTANTFQGNNVSGFTANVAEYFLDVGTQNTVVLGRSGNVVDLGSGNRVTGITRMRDGVPVGQVIREAQTRRRALAEAAKVDGVPQP